MSRKKKHIREDLKPWGLSPTLETFMIGISTLSSFGNEIVFNTTKILSRKFHTQN
ncbi:hypothetical protein Syun_018645 [Stephania yunnanensis]|uniref:Uncharacterized protein n=1 Tax=Stephania yunnanensis TaxID=152371 RepID=A0AAP0NW13_9MAGN